MAKGKKKTIASLIVSLILLAVVIAIMIASDQINSKNKDINVDRIYERDYLLEHCDCIAREILFCNFPGFEVNGSFCRNGSTITNPIRKCSAFSCDGQIVDVKMDFWEDD